MAEFAVNMRAIDKPSAAGGIDGLLQRAGDLQRPLSRLGMHHAEKARRILRSGERDIWTHHESSGLGASMTWALTGPNALMVGSNKRYAGVQQRGGTIESSRGGYLAIPIADNLGVRGDPRFLSPRDVDERYGKGTGFFFERFGKLFFGARRKRPRKREEIGKRLHGLAAKTFFAVAEDTVELLFMLVRKVTIKPHRYATHDPADQQAWNRFAMDWLLRGR